MEGLPRRLGIAWTVTGTHLVVLLIMLLPDIGKILRLFGAGMLQVVGADGWAIALHLLAIAATVVLMVRWHQGDANLRIWFLVAGGANLMISPIGLAPALMFFWFGRRPEVVDAAERMPFVAGAAKTRLVAVWLVADALLLAINFPVLFLVEGSILLWMPATLLTAAFPAALLWRLMRQPKEHDTVQVMPHLPEFR